MSEIKEIIKIINDWEETEFGHYECACIPASKKQIRKLAKRLLARELRAKLGGLRIGQGVYMNKIARKDFLRIINGAIAKIEKRIYK